MQSMIACIFLHFILVNKKVYIDEDCLLSLQTLSSQKGLATIDYQHITVLLFAERL